VILEGKSGLCKTRININGKFYSMVYGYPCSIHVDPIEKKPLYHFYPGSEILSFGTFGCNLFCKGCQNFDITRRDAKETSELRYYHPEEIVDLALENKIKLIAYTYNEPTIFFEYIIDIAKLARKKGIKNIIVSNGYINPEPLKELIKHIDAANIDLKGITEEFYRGYSKTKMQPVLNTIKTLYESGVWIELTNLLIPKLNDDTEDIKKLCKWVKDNVGVNVPLHFSKFYPYYHAKDITPTPSNVVENAKKIALETGLNYVYMGNLGFLDNTCCSKCNKLLVDRANYHVKIVGIKKDKCTKCGLKVPGEF